MIKEFVGRTEQEAINNAIDTLHIEREDFDVEVIEREKKGLFKKGNVKIRIHVAIEEEPSPLNAFVEEKRETAETVPNDEFDQKIKEFLETVISKMGYSGTADISKHEDGKVYFNIESDSSNIVIGRKGKNLDAIQMVANVYGGKLDSDYRVIVDCENYRIRHEEQIVRNAYKVAQIVKKTGRSRLLEPMNPFERRLVHTTLSDVTGIETKSEGEGIFKHVSLFSSKTGK